MFARSIAAPYAALLLVVANAVSATPSPIIPRGDIPDCRTWTGDINTMHFVPLDRGSGMTKNVWSSPTGQSAWNFPTEKKVFLMQTDPKAKETIFQVTPFVEQEAAASATAPYLVKIEGNEECNLSLSQSATSLVVEVFVYYGH